MSAAKAAGDAGMLRELLAAGGELRLAVSGESMRPLLREGDYLVVQPLRGRPRVGEIVVYSRAGRLWAHRVLARSPSGGAVLTKGDARGRPDAPVRPEDMVGRVVAAQRGERLIGLEHLAARLAGLAVSLSAPAAALGVRLARRAGLPHLARGKRTRRVPAAGYVLELGAERRILAALPRTSGRSRGPVDFRLGIEVRRSPTTGGRYGLVAAGGERYTFSTPAVLARIDLGRGECRAEVVPGQEREALAALLRIVSLLLVVGPGRGLALHASAARRSGRAYLFSGPGGAGKSTALERACQAGAEPLADDLVLLRRDGAGRWLAWGPPLEPGLSACGPPPAEGAPVAALLVPARSHGKVELEPLSPARWATLAAASPPGAPLHEALLERLGDLAESVPAFRVRFADRPGALSGLFGLLEFAG